MNKINIIRTIVEIGVAGILSAIIIRKDRQLKKSIENMSKAIEINDKAIGAIDHLGDVLEDAIEEIEFLADLEDWDDDED